jgi:hypothetical protein
MLAHQRHLDIGLNLCEIKAFAILCHHDFGIFDTKAKNKQF